MENEREKLTKEKEGGRVWREGRVELENSTRNWGAIGRRNVR